MKQVFLLVFLISINLCSTAQEQSITIQGKIVDENGNPISDVHIINLASSEKDISLRNGVFTLEVFPCDSLVLSHISYFSKVFSVHSLLVNPELILEAKNVNIQEILISPNQKTDLDRANENIQKIDWDPRPQPMDNYTESERAKQFMDENNRVMRTEASSVSLLRFSVGDMLGKWKKKRERRKLSGEYRHKKSRRK